VGLGLCKSRSIKIALQRRVIIDIILVAVGLMLRTQSGSSLFELVGSAATLLRAFLFTNIFEAAKVVEELLDEGENNRRRYSLSMVLSLWMARDYLTANELQFSTTRHRL
jgi:uncharacterized membrane protein